MTKNCRFKMDCELIANIINIEKLVVENLVIENLTIKMLMQTGSWPK